MISHTNSSLVNSAYTNNIGKTKSIHSNEIVSKQGDTSKIEQIKESIASGDYRVDLEALSKKIADELM